MDDLRDKIERGVVVISETGCWIWMGGTFSTGYARIKSKHFDTETAHRISYIVHKGSIPDGLVVAHKCDIKCCLNPDHLETITKKQNTQDAHDRGLTRKGTRHPLAKLTPDSVREIRRQLFEGCRTVDIGKFHGVSHNAIAQIADGRSWRHVEGMI